MTDVRWLTSPELALACRTGFAPGDRAGVIDAAAEHTRNPQVNPDVPWAMAGPSGADTAVRHYSHDAWDSISATIKLPAKGAVIGALAPVLTPAEPGERRSFMVAFPILGQAAAERTSDNAEFAADMGDELRRRRGGEGQGAAPQRRVQGPRHGRETGPRQRADPPLRGVLRHRPTHRRHRRVRTPPRRLRPPRRVRPAASRPGPGRRRSPPPPSRWGSACPGAAAHEAPPVHPGQPRRGAAARRLRPRPAPPPRRHRSAAANRTCTTTPRSAGSSGRAGAGRPAAAPVSTWRMTSDQAPVLWPLIATPGLPPTGAQMGIDQLSGGSFYADPLGWVLSDQVPVTNPNVFSFGKPGRGKSATTKAFILRMLDFGYRVLILGDPKDEYETLCRALGVEPFAIGHGLPARINPLDFGPLGHGWADLDARRSPAAQRGRVRTLAHPHPRPGRLPTDRRPARPVRTDRRNRHQDRPGPPHRLHHRRDPAGRADHPRPVAPTRRTRHRTDQRMPLPRPPGLLRLHPAAARRARPARVRGAGRAVRRPHHHQRRLARPHPIAEPVPAGTRSGTKRSGSR